jgi:hypothetical protein
LCAKGIIAKHVSISSRPEDFTKKTNHAPTMNTLTSTVVRRLFQPFCLAFALGLCSATAVRAGLAFTVDLYVAGGTFVFYTPMNTNGIGADAPLGNYTITSPGQPTNGSWRQFTYDTNGFNTTDGGENNYSILADALRQITNGLWTLTLTNATTTNTYHFAVSLPGGLTTNQLPVTLITSPADGANNLTNQPTFTWAGQPTNWPVTGSIYLNQYLNNSSFYYPDNVATTQTSWTIPVPIPASNPGSDTYVNLNYVTNYTSDLFVATAPTNISNGQAIAGWAYNSTLESGANVSFTVAASPASSSGHTLVAHYAFDDNGNLGLDSSPNGNDLECWSTWGDNVSQQFTSDAEIGGGAVQFFGESSMTPCNDAQLNHLTNALLGSFTVSTWIKTTNVVDNDADSLNDGDGQTVVYVNNNGNGVIPLGITGTKAAIATGVAPGAYGQDTLNSSGTVTSGSYVQVVVTRDAGSGLKQIYLNGVLDASGYGEPGTLDGGADYASIGGESGAPYTGKLDDVQIYSGALSGTEIANLYANPGTTAPDVSTGNLVAHYTFDDANHLGSDSSGNGYDLNFSSGQNGGGSQAVSDAKAGGGAVDFFRNLSDSSSAGYMGWNPTTPPAVLSALAGSSSVSVWVKTTNSIGTQGGYAFNGAAILAADVNGIGNDIVPLALTGGQAACNVGDTTDGYDDTLNSHTTVTNGNWHHLVVTRNQPTGERDIYIDGVLNASDTATTNLLNASQLAVIGAIRDGSNPNPNGGNYYAGFSGEMDDLQIYSGVLSAGEVTFLYNNPGQTTGGSGGTDFNTALGTTNLNWSTSGDTSWFIETTNTYNGSPAAVQSGSVTGDQSSTLSVTVTGPGSLTFYWASQNDCNNFDYEFDIDGNYQDDISCSQPWEQDGPFIILAGTHTLTWTTSANGDTDPAEAGFLDQVSFAPGSAPIITLNPFNQTNYPGYAVALLAAATSNPTATWQWFKVGSASPISNATNALFIPSNSGMVGVAGSYYGVATTLVGSANTTTALVSFVSAPLPPAWSHALKSPFTALDPSTITKDYYDGCAVDSAGDVYVAAQYIGNVNVLTNGNVENVLTTVGVNGGAALVKYNASGNAVWAVGLTNNQATSFSYGLCVAPAPGNGAYVASIVIGTNWLGANKFVDVAGASILLSRFDANGSNVWSRFLTGTNFVIMDYNMLASDSSGNVTLGGNLSGTASLGGTNLSATGGAGFIVQYDTNGAVRWAQTVPDNMWGLAYGNGLLYASMQSTISDGVTNVSIGSLSNLTDRAWAVAALDGENGQALWLRGLGESYGANPNGLIIDVPLVSAAGTNVFILGNAFGTSALFGGLSVSLPGARGEYFARYDTNGNAQVATGFGSLTTTIWASAADASGIYISGDFDNYSEFGSDIIAAPVFAQNDLGANYYTQPFIAKFDQNGNALWARNGVSSDLANFRGIAVASDGVWAAGFLKITNSIPAQFDTYNVYSASQTVSGGPGGSENVFWYQSGLLAKITDSVAAASPVTLLNPLNNGANFQFQFLSQPGFTHNILYRTNLATGFWQTNLTVTGDGTVKTVSIPYSLFSPSKQGFIRVSTQ